MQSPVRPPESLVRPEQQLARPDQQFNRAQPFYPAPLRGRTATNAAKTSIAAMAHQATATRGLRCPHKRPTTACLQATPAHNPMLVAEHTAARLTPTVTRIALCSPIPLAPAWPSGARPIALRNQAPHALLPRLPRMAIAASASPCCSGGFQSYGGGNAHPEPFRAAAAPSKLREEERLRMIWRGGGGYAPVLQKPATPQWRRRSLRHGNWRMEKAAITTAADIEQATPVFLKRRNALRNSMRIPGRHPFHLSLQSWSGFKLFGLMRGCAS